MNVAGSRRCVENEIVQLAPIGIGDELLQGIRGHAATPQGGRLRTDKESDTQQFDTIFLDGLDEITSIHMHGIGALILHIKHFRHAWSEDVGVEQTHLIAQSCQGDGQIGRNGRLAYPTLARADGNDVLHLWQQLAHLRTRFRLKLGVDGHLHVFRHMVVDGSLSSFYCRLEEGVCVAGELQHHAYLPLVALSLRSSHTRCIGHHAAFHEIFLCAWISNLLQGIHNEFRIDSHVHYLEL